MWYLATLGRVQFFTHRDEAGLLRSTCYVENSGNTLNVYRQTSITRNFSKANVGTVDFETGEVVFYFRSLLQHYKTSLVSFAFKRFRETLTQFQIATRSFRTYRRSVGSCCRRLVQQNVNNIGRITAAAPGRIFRITAYVTLCVGCSTQDFKPHSLGHPELYRKRQPEVCRFH